MTWKNIDRKVLSQCLYLFLPIRLGNHPIQWVWTVTSAALPSVALHHAQVRLRSELVKVGGPVLVFEGEGFKALGHGFMLLLLRLLLLLLLLSEGETGGDAGRGGAVAGSGPHGGLQHLHGVTPLRGRRDVHLVQGRAGIGHGVCGVGGMLPWRFGRPGFCLAVLWNTADIISEPNKKVTNTNLLNLGQQLLV